MLSRVDYLDVLRGVAILLVMFFHAYSRWPQIVPYGDAYKGFPLFQLGWLGVELFFMISGFVIFMTLDKTESFKIFIYKRWLRLFPAMLLASMLIYLTIPLFADRPAGIPNLIDLLPGLTFIEPDWWSLVIGNEVSSLEGAFWSLYVEFKFYVISGLIYYLLGRKFLVPCLFCLFLVSIIIVEAKPESDSEQFSFLLSISNNLSLKYFGWFCAGSIFYLYKQNKRESYYLSGIVVAVLSSYATGLYFHAFIAAIIISCLFALSLRLVFLQKILAYKIFMLFGFVSYPLYLIHENAMVSMIVKSSSFLPWLNQFFYPFLPIMLLVIVSFFIAQLFEPRLKNFLVAVTQSKINKVFYK